MKTYVYVRSFSSKRENIKPVTKVMATKELRRDQETLIMHYNTREGLDSFSRDWEPDSFSRAWRKVRGG